jgi:hypothetical protein
MTGKGREGQVLGNFEHKVALGDFQGGMPGAGSGTVTLLALRNAQFHPRLDLVGIG